MKVSKHTENGVQINLTNEEAIALQNLISNMTIKEVNVKSFSEEHAASIIELNHKLNAELRN